MSEFGVHRYSGGVVLDADQDIFSVLLNLANEIHKPPSDRIAGRFRGLADVLTELSAGLPQRPERSWKMREFEHAEDVPGVDYVSYSTHVTVGIHRALAEQILDCMQVVVTDGDDDLLPTVTGADFREIRTMYLTLASALGTLKTARGVAFGQPPESPATS